MTIRNLDAVFEPKTIALVGASNQPHSVGAVLARNLFDAGFAGPVLSVNPHERAVRSTLNYRSIAELPTVPDLAVIATPPSMVPELVAELGGRGCRAGIIVTAGFGEGARSEGEALRQKLLDAARPHLFRIVGPNCLGVISTARRINASFAPLMPEQGTVALVSQSGAVATALLDWAAARRIGFSHVVSLGDMVDVDFGDVLDYLALDSGTRAILLYVESVTAARKFMSAARIASRAKPVIVVKSGRKPAAARAALSHTGALAGSDLVYDAAFRRAGMLRVIQLRELFEALATLSLGLSPAGDRLAILTNGGGAGVMAVDALDDEGGRLAALSPDTTRALDSFLPTSWSGGNPVDILGDATGERYGKALAALLADPGKDALLVINCPTAVADSREAASAVTAAVLRESTIPVLTCWLGEVSANPSRGVFEENAIPTYETPEEAVRAFMHLAHYRRNQDLLLETPPPMPEPANDKAAVSAILKAASDAGEMLLGEAEAKAILTAYGIPTVETRAVASPSEAALVATTMKGPFALKIRSPDISHKSDVGGVHLDLDASAIKAAAKAMLGIVKQRAKGARLSGFTVEPMVRRSHAWELLVGLTNDPTFGPVVLFGQGGTSAEVVGDRAIGFPPLNAVLARDMIERTRVFRLLAGFRDRPPANLAAIEACLIRVGQLAMDFPEISEIDINPLLADENGAIALDARMVLQRAATARQPSIAPYPAKLAREIVLPDGLKILLRPIKPEDEPLLIEMVRRSTTADIRLRFLGSLREFPHRMAARLSQIDYDREMAFVALQRSDEGRLTEMLGVARLISDPENDKAEFAVMVRSDLKGRGLGYALMSELIAFASRRGLKKLVGDVLRENRTMLQMAGELGFIVHDTLAPDVVAVQLDLT